MQTITDAAVEKVAEAIFDADPDAPDAIAFDEVHYSVRDPYFAMARAAMKAVLEPPLKN